MRLRRRVQFLYWVPVSLLVVVGYVMDRRATALRSTHAEKCVSDLSVRLDTLSKRLDEISQSMQNRSAVDRLVAEGNEAPNGAESVGGYPNGLVCRPRILGSGRNGRYLYTDVRHVDGQVLRYYIAANATPLEVRAFVRSMAEDAQDRRFAVSVAQND